jgi:hypothetical protein
MESKKQKRVVKEPDQIKHRIVLKRKPPKKKTGFAAHNPEGRPEMYTEDIAAFICRELMLGKTITKICKDKRIPSMPTVFNWLNSRHKLYKPEFAKSYKEAREIQAEVLADQTIDIADDGSNDTYEKMNPKTGKTEVFTDHDNIKRSALRVETRKWNAAHTLPRKYSDRIQVTGSEGKDLIPTTTKIVVHFIKPETK